MNRVLKAFLLLFAVGLFIGFVGYSYNYYQIQIRLVGSETGKSAKPLNYHFSVILQDSSSSLWQDLESGAKKAGRDYDAAIEFNTTVVRNEQEELQYLNIAIASRVDGIAIYISNNELFTPSINKAAALGIPVVTIESDAKGSNRLSYVGPNSYNAGYTAGSLVGEATNGSANVAIIFSGNYPGDATTEATLTNGFQFAGQSYPGMKMQVFKTPDSSYFGAEKVIRNILTNMPQINAIVCTSSDDTLEVTKVLIDLNKVGKVTVIGYNNLPQIRDYIRNNVIYGAVVENPVQTGYQSIKALVTGCQKGAVNNFIDTQVGRMTRGNLLEYPGSASDGSES